MYLQYKGIFCLVPCACVYKFYIFPEENFYKKARPPLRFSVVILTITYIRNSSKIILRAGFLRKNFFWWKYKPSKIKTIWINSIR